MSVNRHDWRAMVATRDDVAADAAVRHLVDADEAYHVAKDALAVARHDRAVAVEHAYGAGLSLRDIASRLGVHHTRVKQLLAEAA